MLGHLDRLITTMQTRLSKNKPRVLTEILKTEFV